jgi:tetratricopeptide (TPR) repeat protein
MMITEDLGRRYYRLGLAAAKRRDLRTALAYAKFACFLYPEQAGAVRLAEICRIELGEEIPEPDSPSNSAPESPLNRIALLVSKKKWKDAALAARSFQSVRFLNIQGCLWALARRYGSAFDCFAKVLTKDRGNPLAVEALVCLGRRRKFLGGFFVPL